MTHPFITNHYIFVDKNGKKTRHKYPLERKSFRINNLYDGYNHTRNYFWATLTGHVGIALDKGLINAKVGDEITLEFHRNFLRRTTNTIASVFKIIHRGEVYEYTSPKALNISTEAIRYFWGNDLNGLINELNKDLSEDKQLEKVHTNGSPYGKPYQEEEE